MTEDLELDNIALWGRTLNVDSDQLIRSLRKFRDLDIPENLGNNVVSINEEDLENSALMFSENIPTSQEEAMILKGEVNLLMFNVQDGDLFVSADLDGRYVSEFVDIFDEILAEVDLHILDFDRDFVISEPFSELQISIEGPDNFDYEGINFINDGAIYTIQSTLAEQIQQLERNEEIEQNEVGEKNITRANVSDVEHFDVSESGDFIENKVSEARGTLEMIIP